MYQHDKNSPRHARMFELLRQSQQAKTTAQRLKRQARHTMDVEFAVQLRDRAVASLRGPAQNTAVGRSAFHR